MSSFPFYTKFVNLEYIFYKIYIFLHKIFGITYKGRSPSLDSRSLNNVLNQGRSTPAKAFWDVFGSFLEFVAFIGIIFLLTLLLYSIIRIFEVRKREKEFLEEEMREFAYKESLEKEKIDAFKNPRWKAVLEYINSKEESDWKLAILEADALLDSLVSDLGFKGETLGEKLKSVDKDKFKNLNSIWEAHNLRNKIAHEGSSFSLTHHEAKRIIGMYEQVFRDYKYI